jgi:spermidine/putrescine transport system permease protein
MMVGNLIQHEYLVIRDWPFGSAIAFVLMALVVLGVMVYLRRGGVFEGVEAQR